MYKEDRGSILDTRDPHLDVTPLTLGLLITVITFSCKVISNQTTKVDKKFTCFEFFICALRRVKAASNRILYFTRFSVFNRYHRFFFLAMAKFRWVWELFIVFDQTAFCNIGSGLQRIEFLERWLVKLPLMSHNEVSPSHGDMILISRIEFFTKNETNSEDNNHVMCVYTDSIIF